MDQEQRLTAIRAGLLEHCIEVQALANKIHHTSAEHRDHAREVKAQAFELSKLVRKLAPSPQELDTLRMFFPAHTGRKADDTKFVHLED